MGKPRVKIEQREDGRFDWSLYGGNGAYVCGSFPQGFNTPTDADRAYARAAEILAGLPTAEIVPHHTGTEFVDPPPPGPAGGPDRVIGNAPPQAPA